MRTDTQTDGPKYRHNKADSYYFYFLRTNANGAILVLFWVSTQRVEVITNTHCITNQKSVVLSSRVLFAAVGNLQPFFFRADVCGKFKFYRSTSNGNSHSIF
jgi:hypothetical protein